MIAKTSHISYKSHIFKGAELEYNEERGYDEPLLSKSLAVGTHGAITIELQLIVIGSLYE